MRYKLFGRSGLRVAEISLGAMTFGEEWGWGADKGESLRILDLYGKAGGNFIDTADMYTNGTSEKIVGEFIRGDRSHWVLATKYTLSGDDANPNGNGNHRKRMREALEASLKRLGVEYVDIYWLHAWDFFTPVEEVMRALDDLVRSGKVLYVGVSDTPAWLVSQANTVASLMGWTPFTGLQIEYSLLERTPERDLLPMARAFEMAVTPWSPLGSGVLTGKYTRVKPGARPEDSKRVDAMNMFPDKLSPRSLAIAREVDRVADEIGCSSAQVALNWVRARPGVMVPIVGARTVAQLEQSLDCLKYSLSDGQLESLDSASRIELGFPHDFLKNEMVKSIRFGQSAGRIDNHRSRELP